MTNKSEADRFREMRIIRGQPATGEPPQIIRSRCGKPAPEAGIACRPGSVQEGYQAAAADSGLTSGPTLVVEEGGTDPLCEDCVTALGG